MYAFLLFLEVLPYYKVVRNKYVVLSLVIYFAVYSSVPQDIVNMIMHALR